MVDKTRLRSGRKEQPTAGIIDSQSVKSTLVSSESKGFDAGKRIKGSKRRIIVDTLGLVLAVVIQSGSLQDRDGAAAVISKMLQSYRKVTILFADGSYRGKLIGWVKSIFKISLQIIKRDEKHNFKVVPKRWMVERTFAWIDAHRRNAKNYERLNNTSIAMVQLASIKIMVNRF